MILLDDYRRSQLVWKDEMQVELWSEYNADKFLDVFWQIWPQKKTNSGTESTTSSENLTTGRPGHFFPPENNPKMPKIKFSGGKKKLLGVNLK